MQAVCVLALTLFCSALAGAAEWRQYLKADDAVGHGKVRNGVRITYLGTNGYLLESRGAAVVVDPYFSRIGIGAFALNSPIATDAARLSDGLRHLPPRIDAVVVTHGHVDHLFDAPAVARATRARLIASKTSTLLAIAGGFPSSRCATLTALESVQVAGAKITALPASHDRVCGIIVPYPGELVSAPKKAPSRPGDWRCGEPLAYLIEIGGRRIYIDSGGTPAVLPPRLGPIDLAIMGTALADSRRRLTPALARLRPKLFLPSHQDNFFLPLDRGFQFGWLTDFPAVQRIAASSGVSMITLDYFRPWTLR